MNKQVIPLGELFSLTWSQYKQRALPLIAVILISSVIVGSLAIVMVLGSIFSGAILAHLPDKTAGIYVIGGLLGLFTIFIFILLFWCQAAMFAILIDEEIGIIEAFQQGWHYFWPLTWVVTILSGILITGFSLALLPGFLFLTWFSFSVFILFEEDRRGMEAMLVSREYVRGYGWNVFGKMALAWLLSTMAGLFPFIGQILSIILAPFFMLYLLNMYRDLKAIKGDIEPADDTTSTIFWWTVSTIGLILPIAGLLWLVYFLLTGDQQLLPPLGQGMHGTAL